MNLKNNQKLFLPCLLLAAGLACRAQTPDNVGPPQEQSQPSPQDNAPRHRLRGQMEGRGTIGQITAIQADSLTITRPDGAKVSVKLTGKTEFRKDRQPAKLADFKVGDFVMVRGEENPDHSITAEMLGGRSAGTGPGGGSGGGAFFGEMGKDFLAGEVKSLDPPKVTLQRPDNVTQTVELNEDTSLRKGRESITMADIQPGDHLVMHGASQNGVFVPKTVMLVSPEQWERMQQFAKDGAPMSGNAGNPPAPAKPPQQ